jgi:hypothetical protein
MQLALVIKRPGDEATSNSERREFVKYFKFLVNKVRYFDIH